MKYFRYRMRVLWYHLLYFVCAHGMVKFLMIVLDETDTNVYQGLKSTYCDEYFWFLDFMKGKHYRHQRYDDYFNSRMAELVREAEDFFRYRNTSK